MQQSDTDQTTSAFVPGLLIRAFRPTDVTAIMNIAVRAWEPIYAQSLKTLGPELFAARFGDDWRVYKATQVERGALERPGQFLAAEMNDEIVGFASWELDPSQKIGTIMNNAVDPTWRGRGIGPAMYETMLTIFREAGMQHAYVETGGDPAHAAAVRAYEKAGFNIRVDVVRLYRAL